MTSAQPGPASLTRTLSSMFGVQHRLGKPPAAPVTLLLKDKPQEGKCDQKRSALFFSPSLQQNRLDFGLYFFVKGLVELPFNRCPHNSCHASIFTSPTPEHPKIDYSLCFVSRRRHLSFYRKCRVTPAPCQAGAGSASRVACLVGAMLSPKDKTGGGDVAGENFFAFFVFWYVCVSKLGLWLPNRKGTHANDHVEVKPVSTYSHFRNSKFFFFFFFFFCEARTVTFPF